MSIASRRVIAVTPAGRRRYMALLLSFTHREHLAGFIDEHHLTVNTTDIADVEWCKRVAEQFPFVKLDWLPKGQAGGWHNIHKMFIHCIDPDTIYIRLDDDIIYIAPDAIWRLVQFRLENPGYFLAFANTINNAICSHLHYRMGILDWPAMPGYDCMDAIGWNNPAFAEHAHRTFLGRLENGTVDRYRFSRWEVGNHERFSINAFAFRGEDFAAFKGAVKQDEEPWLTQVKTVECGKINAICGESIMSHFAFYTQRDHIDNTDILARYRDVAWRECPDSHGILGL